MQLHEWVEYAANNLVSAGIDTAKLDAELILSHTLRKPRTWLHMYRDEPLSLRMQEIANARLRLRLERVPLAYIIGHKEFYGRRFKVRPGVLIPRPESEAIIELLKASLPATTSLLPASTQLVDVGTGSGALGITTKLLFPELKVSLIDTSKAALKIAKENAATLHADVKILKSDLLADYPFEAGIILANLPYVDESWQRSPETDHEPPQALFAGRGGVSLIFELLGQTESRLKVGGLLILEADPVQHSTIIAKAKTHGLAHQKTDGYALLFKKD